MFWTLFGYVWLDRAQSLWVTDCHLYHSFAHQGLHCAQCACIDMVQDMFALPRHNCRLIFWLLRQVMVRPICWLCFCRCCFDWCFPQTFFWRTWGLGQFVDFKLSQSWTDHAGQLQSSYTLILISQRFEINVCCPGVTRFLATISWCLCQGCNWLASCAEHIHMASREAAEPTNGW